MQPLVSSPAAAFSSDAGVEAAATSPAVLVVAPADPEGTGVVHLSALTGRAVAGPEPAARARRARSRATVPRGPERRGPLAHAAMAGLRTSGRRRRNPDLRVRRCPTGHRFPDAAASSA